MIVIVFSVAVFMGLVIGCEQDRASARAASTESVGNLAEGATLSEVLRHPDALQRVAWLAEFLAAASTSQLESIRYAIEEAPLDRGDLEYTLFGEWWARFDPEAAFGWAESQLRSRHPRVIATIVRGWARWDPAAAIASGLFYEVAPGAPIYRVELLDALIVGWFESGKPGLEDFLTSLDDPSDVTYGMQTYARSRALRDGFRETLEWAQNTDAFPADHQRLLLAGALSVAAAEEPELAAGRLPFLEASGVDIRGFIQRIARNWAEHDPRAAMDWLSGLSDSGDRNSALLRVAGIWGRVDESALAGWMAEHEGEGWVDPVRVQSFKRRINEARYHVDWPEEMSRLDVIQDDRKREVTRLWLAQRWMIVDETRARAWMDAHPDLIPEEKRARVEKAPVPLQERVLSAFEQGQDAA